MRLKPAKTREEKRAWLKEFYKAVGYSILLSNQQDETGLRQGYILLDNAVEQLIKIYLKNTKTTGFDRKKKYSFFDLIDLTKKEVKIDEALLERLVDFHDSRNILYHQSTNLSVSKDKFQNYLDDVFLLCKSLKLKKANEDILGEYTTIIRSIFHKKLDERYVLKQEIENMIKDNFGIIPGEYHGDILLGSAIGHTAAALDNFITIISGILARGKKARVLEAIEMGSTRSFHNYFLSYDGSHTWYCFIDCFWSPDGEGERRDIKKIRSLIEANKNKIVYKQDFINKGYLKAFDPYYSGD